MPRHTVSECKVSHSWNEGCVKWELYKLHFICTFSLSKWSSSKSWSRPVPLTEPEQFTCRNKSLSLILHTNIVFFLLFDRNWLDYLKDIDCFDILDFKSVFSCDLFVLKLFLPLVLRPWWMPRLCRLDLNCSLVLNWDCKHSIIIHALQFLCEKATLRSAEFFECKILIVRMYYICCSLELYEPIFLLVSRCTMFGTFFFKEYVAENVIKKLHFYFMWKRVWHVNIS